MQVLPRAIRAPAGPLVKLHQLVDLALGGEHLARAAGGHFQPPGAEVIAPALAQTGAELQAQVLAQEGQVLLDQLLLQGDGVGGNDHPPGILHGQDGRHQVGEALAHARAGFNQQVLPLGEGFFHRLGHRQLLGPPLVPAQGEGHGPLGREKFRRPAHIPPGLVRLRSVLSTKKAVMITVISVTTVARMVMKVRP